MKTHPEIDGDLDPAAFITWLEDYPRRGTVMLNDVASFLDYIDQQTGGWGA